MAGCHVATQRVLHRANASFLSVFVRAVTIACGPQFFRRRSSPAPRSASRASAFVFFGCGCPSRAWYGGRPLLRIARRRLCPPPQTSTLRAQIACVALAFPLSHCLHRLTDRDGPPVLSFYARSRGERVQRRRWCASTPSCSSSFAPVWGASDSWTSSGLLFSLPPHRGYLCSRSASLTVLSARLRDRRIAARTSAPAAYTPTPPAGESPKGMAHRRRLRPRLHPRTSDERHPLRFVTRRHARHLRRPRRRVLSFHASWLALSVLADSKPATSFRARACRRIRPALCREIAQTAFSPAPRALFLTCSRCRGWRSASPARARRFHFRQLDMAYIFLFME